ncbi:MAG: DUF1704 domain-containing protein [Sandaracinaceae bacterium]|nr:DUF1704 domain-containing protein [Sandaracinaceae bacterium]
MDPARTTELDRRLVEAASKVNVLARLTWSEGVVEGFLASWREGAPRLPEVSLEVPDLSDVRAELDAVARAADPSDPLQAFVRTTAESYSTAARMLESIGTPAFTELSSALYGRPDDRVPGGVHTHDELADSLLANTDDLRAAGIVRDVDLCLTADEVASHLGQAFGEFFGAMAPSIEVDPDLASKAAAGATRVRLRGRTCFSKLDVAQLREHEGFIHAATMLNGRAQPVLSCMGISTPRTTLTQEGLATFAEVITHSIDIARLRRLALRTVAIHAALDGADFVEVFRVFLDGGQSEDESARSAMRVFRGGDVRGRVAFTKDVVYLAGLVAVHSYLRKAIAEGRPELVRRLFSGRLALADIVALAPGYDAGHLDERGFVAPWATDLDRLGAYLAFSAALDRVDLSMVSLGAPG